MGYGLEAGQVAGDAEALANLRHLGRAIDWLGRTIRGNSEPYPAQR